MFGFEQHNPHHDRDVWQHTVAVVAHIPPEPVLRWAALLHDVGKPPCFSLGPDGVGHFYGHAAKSAELADAILMRLRFDTAGRTRITQPVSYTHLDVYKRQARSRARSSSRSSSGRRCSTCRAPHRARCCRHRRILQM